MLVSGSSFQENILLSFNESLDRSCGELKFTSERSCTMLAAGKSTAKPRLRLINICGEVDRYVFLR